MGHPYIQKILIKLAQVISVYNYIWPIVYMYIAIFLSKYINQCLLIGHPAQGVRDSTLINVQTDLGETYGTHPVV